MTARLARIDRHPIKSHGRETLASVFLHEGRTMPFDRLWAVAHDHSKARGQDWAACRNFTRIAGSPALAAISAEVDEETEIVTLRHPDRAPLTFHPDRDAERMIAWVRGLVPENRPQPVAVLRGAERGYTDSETGHVTICSLASHRAVEARIGHELAPERWRCNLWIEGPDAWAEFDWIDRELRIGQTVLRILGRTERCMATQANPLTGLRDASILDTLDSFGHRDFSVKAQVVQSGRIRIDDLVEVP